MTNCNAMKEPVDNPTDEEIERVREDHDFTARARRLLERDKELLERLAQ